MYIGNNPTALRSMEWFADAILQLMHDNDYSKINIKDICKKADLSRQTFYQFFSSKEDLIRFCIREHFLCWDAIPCVNDLNEISEQMIKHISNNKEFIQLLSRHHLGHILTEELSKNLTIIADKIDPNRDPKTKELAHAFITAGLSNTFLAWAENSTNITENELIHLLFMILKGRYFKI